MRKKSFSSSFWKYFSRIILKASLFANGYPVRGSLYLAGAPVTAQFRDTRPKVFPDPYTIAVLVPFWVSV
jgi:hypothetical protein